MTLQKKKFHFKTYQTYQNHSGHLSMHISRHRRPSQSSYTRPGPLSKGRDPELRFLPLYSAEGTMVWSFPAHFCPSFFCLYIRHQVLTPQFQDLQLLTILCRLGMGLLELSQNFYGMINVLQGQSPARSDCRSSSK